MLNETFDPNSRGSVNPTENWLSSVPIAKKISRVWPAPVKALRDVSSLKDEGQRAMSKLRLVNDRTGRVDGSLLPAAQRLSGHNF